MSSIQPKRFTLHGKVVREKIKKLNKSINYFAKIHNRSNQRIYDALSGKAPELLQKIEKHIEKLESNQIKNGSK